MLRKIATSVPVVGLFLWFGLTDGRAEAIDDPALIKALDGVQVTMANGLKVSETVGKPISAKFEIDEGHLRLSVYALANDGYREDVISPDTGVIMSAQKIADTDDLAAAEAQKKAMQAATVPLRIAADRAASRMTGS